MKTSIAILAAILMPALATAATVTPHEQPAVGPVDVDVWLDRADGSVYDYGQALTIRFRTEADSYVAIYNVDSDGYLGLLYPRYGDPQWVEAGRIYSIPGPRENYDLIVDGPKGIEYVVAVASPYPLRLNTLESSSEYWYRSASVGGRISGDPSQAIWDVNERLAWDGNDRGPEGYASDVAWFYVRAEVPYPRYLIYEWYPDRYWDPFWDPYVSVNLWVDWRWDHHWCHRNYWHWGHRPQYDYWYRDRHNGPQLRWKNVYHDVKPGDWKRDKPGRPPVAVRDVRRAPKPGRDLYLPDRPDQRSTRVDDRPTRSEDRPQREDRPARNDDRPQRDDRPAVREDKPANRPEAAPAPPRAEERKPSGESKPAAKPEERPSRKQRENSKSESKPAAKSEARPSRR